MVCMNKAGMQIMKNVYGNFTGKLDRCLSLFFGFVQNQNKIENWKIILESTQYKQPNSLNKLFCYGVFPP